MQPAWQDYASNGHCQDLLTVQFDLVVTLQLTSVLLGDRLQGTSSIYMPTAGRAT